MILGRWVVEQALIVYVLTPFWIFFLHYSFLLFLFSTLLELCLLQLSFLQLSRPFQAANLNLVEFSRLRASLLEQTYTWASADQRHHQLAKTGAWQGSDSGRDSSGTGGGYAATDMIEMDSLPKMMVEGQW
jgi:hypothetical protein